MIRPALMGGSDDALLKYGVFYRQSDYLKMDAVN